LEVLLNCGYPINIENDLGQTALMAACSQWNLEAASYLLSSGADPSKKCADLTCLHIIAYIYRYGRCPNADEERLWAGLATRLVDSGCPLEARDKEGRTPLIAAIISTSLTVATALLSAGADWRSQDDYGKGLVDYFDYPREGYGEDLGIPFLTKLVAAGAPVDISNPKGQTLLHIMSEGPISKRRLGILGWILEQGGDPSLSDSEGKKPLHYLLGNISQIYSYTSNIMSTPFIDILSGFIRGCDDINAIVGPLGTPLHILVSCLKGAYRPDCLLRTLHLLISSGADISKVNTEGETPAAMAMRLLAKGPRVQSINSILEVIEELIPPGMGENSLKDGYDKTIHYLTEMYPDEHTSIAHFMARIENKMTANCHAVGEIDQS
jgi:ankyrin repeat protein